MAELAFYAAALILVACLVSVRAGEAPPFDLEEMLKGFAGGGSGGSGGAHEPRGVACHRSMVAAQNKRAIASNGCTGSDMFQVDGQEDFTYCCDLHDACYETCGVSRKKCDTEFKKCMLDLCDSQFSENPKCLQAAKTYHLGVTALGSSFYQEAQSDHCECIDQKKSVIQKHYKSLIMDFYDKHNPEKKTTFDWSKYKDFADTSKFANLFLQLYKRNYDAIEHVGARSGKNPVRPSSSQGNKKTTGGDSGDRGDQEEL